jgi:hypothetical protein
MRRSAALVLALGALSCRSESMPPRAPGTGGAIAPDATVEAPRDLGATGGTVSIDTPPPPMAGSMGVPDVGVPDLPAPADASGGGGCPGVLCEDFESGQIDPTRWDVRTSGGHTAAIAQDMVAHGKFAARFHAPAGATGFDFIISKSAPAALHGHHYGRAYVLATPKPPAGHTGLMFAGTSGFPKLKYLEVAAIRGGWQLTFVQLVGNPTGEKYYHVDPAEMMPMQKWVCIEWEFNDQPDRIVLTVNGKLTATDDPIVYNNAMTDLVGGFTDFGFGFYDWHPDNFAFDIYYDDIVLDTKPVGCLP